MAYSDSSRRTMPFAPVYCSHFGLRYGSLPQFAPTRKIMAPAAVVFRHGHFVAHINDLAALPAVVALLSEASGGDEHASTAALVALEKAVSVARANGFSGVLGRIARQLRDAGF